MSDIFKEFSQPCPLCRKGTLRPTEGRVRPDGNVVIERVCDNCGHQRPKVIVNDRPRVEALKGFIMRRHKK